jgi:hypothetical protein
MEERRLITYEFELNSGRLRFELIFQEPSHMLVPVDSTHAPEWTRLDFQKCPNCPLNSAEVSHCPLALQLHRVVRGTDDLVSHDEVRVKVRSAERYYGTKTTAQRALSSLLGLIIPCSGCPHTEALRPLARYHLPFSDQEETSYRIASMYLLAQYMRQTHQLEADFNLDKLDRLYQPIQVVNRFICQRLRSICEKDSSLNAVVILDTLTMIVPLTIQGHLEKLTDLFKPYLEAEVMPGMMR